MASSGDAQAKVCRKCGEAKVLEEFKRNPRTRDGLSSWCSACYVAAVRESRRRHLQRYNAAARARYRARVGPRKEPKRGGSP